MKYKIWIGLALSVVLMAVVLYQVDFASLVASIRKARLELVLLAVVCLLSTQLTKAWRWKFLMGSLKSIPTLTLLSPTVIGAMTDMVLPARGGDVVRACILGHNESVSKMSTLATLAIEKALDVAAVLLIALPLVILVPFPGEVHAVVTTLRITVAVAGILCAGLFAAIFFSAWQGKGSISLLERLQSYLPAKLKQRAQQWGKDFLVGINTIKQSHVLLPVALLSLLLWCTNALSNYLILSAFGLDLPLYAPFLFLVFQVFGVTLPSSPGFIGTYHAAVVAAFALFQVNQEVAISVAIVMHAAFFFPFILAGWFFLWMENLTFQSLPSLESTQP